MLLPIAKFHSFFWLSSITLCVCTHTHRILFTHSSVDGQLGRFRILAIVNSPPVNTGVHVSFQIGVFGLFWDAYAGVELRDPCQLCFPLSEESSFCFPQWLCRLAFLSGVEGSARLSASSPAFVLSDVGRSDRCEVMSHCGFSLRFSDSRC